MVTLNDTTVMGIGFYKFKNPSRFSFVVVKRGNDWMIAHHHSSLIPLAVHNHRDAVFTVNGRFWQILLQKSEIEGIGASEAIS
jgi:hypothetical protein